MKAFLCIAEAVIEVTTIIQFDRIRKKIIGAACNGLFLTLCCCVPRYKECDDGFFRLQTFRFESVELTEELMVDDQSSSNK